MNVAQEEIVDRQTVLHIALEDDDLEPYLDRGYQRVVRNAVIPGFRKGRAPRFVVERFLGRESLLTEALDFMLPEVTARAIEGQELEAAGLPDIELVNLEPLEIKATVALTPEIDLGAYREIRIDLEPVEVSEKDVEDRLEELRRSTAPWEPVDRPVQVGDLVSVDLETRVGDQEAHTRQGELIVSDEDEDAPSMSIAKELVGAVKGEPREFTLPTPDSAEGSTADGDTHFRATVSEIKEQRLPDLDDEFAKGVGEGFDSLSALRENIEAALRAEAELSRDASYEEAAMGRLTESCSVVLPPLLVDHEIEHIMADRERFFQRMNVRMDDYLRFSEKSEDDLREEARESAVGRLSRTYLLSKLAEVEGVEATDAEVDERIERASTTDEGGRRGRRKSKRELEEARRSAHHAVRLEKTLERLVVIAKGEAPDEAADAGESGPTDEGGEPGQGNDADDK